MSSGFPLQALSAFYLAMQGGKKRSGLPGMGDRPLKKRLKKSSAEPDGQAGLVNGKGGRGVMGLNPLVGHKVDRFWADVSFCI